MNKFFLVIVVALLLVASMGFKLHRGYRSSRAQVREDEWDHKCGETQEEYESWKAVIDEVRQNPDNTNTYPSADEITEAVYKHANKELGFTQYKRACVVFAAGAQTDYTNCQVWERTRELMSRWHGHSEEHLDDLADEAGRTFYGDWFDYETICPEESRNQDYTVRSIGA